MFCLLLQESEKENQEISFLQQSDTCPQQYKEKTDDKLILMSSEKTHQQHVTKDFLKVSGSNKTKPTECQTGNPEAEINTTNDSSNRETKSASSQTEDSLYPHSAPAAPELRCAYTQTEEEELDDELVASPPVSPVTLSATAESGNKTLFSGSFPIPADPARLAERIRRNRTQLSAAFDDTEYEPYGLPEVVMKGNWKTDHLKYQGRVILGWCVLKTNGQSLKVLLHGGYSIVLTFSVKKILFRGNKQVIKCYLIEPDEQFPLPVFF